jgi:hypothetical protein
MTDTPTKAMLPLLLLNDADTLVFIDPSPEDRSKNNILTPTIPHRVHSEKLLATGSAYFQRLFTPRYQTRVRKRRGFADNLPSGVKYVIDLTPPTVDEEAIIVLTEVSCPTGIRTWASRLKEWSLPPSCVGGEDELEVLSKVPECATSHNNTTLTAYGDGVNHPSALDWEDEGLPQDEDEYLFWSRQSTRTALPVTYSAKRHREGIEHILHVLEGLNVSLDTPCKLWTFFAVAKLFDVAEVPTVSDHIMSWFYHSSNIRFLEVHPEIAYRVSCGIKSAPLCTDSFVGLVGDEALLYIMREARLTPPKSWAPIFDRSRIADFLDDTDVQRIEYASKSFADKIMGDFLNLAGTDMPWFANVKEFEKIKQHQQDFPEDEELVTELITKLKDFIRSRIFRVLCHARDPRRSCNITPSDQGFGDGNKFPRQALVQRVIGRQFWLDLFHLDLDSTILTPLRYDQNSIADIGNGMTAFQGQEHAWLLHVLRQDVEQRVREFNMRVRYQASKIAFHPSKRIALGASSSDFSNSSVNMRRPFQAAEPLTSTDDGNNKLLTLNLRYPQSSQPAQGAGNSTTIDKLTSLVHRPHLYSSGENSTPERISDTLSPSIPSTTTTPTSSSSSLGGTITQLDTKERSFNLDRFFSGVREWVDQLSRTLLIPHGDATTALEATDTLFSLTDDQFRFLPLWAGGNDDGSGGVFTDQNIPVMETGGFSAPGPAVHTGSVASTNTDSSLSEIGPDDSQSTIHGASHHATFSHASDLLSVDSFGGPSQGSHNERSQTGDLAISAPASAIFLGCGEDFDVRSDGSGTVIGDLPRLSDIDDDNDIDIDMEHPDIDDDDDHDNHDSHDDDFEMIDPN